MKRLYALLLLLPFTSIAQQQDDSKIILTPSQTDSLYYRVKYALGKCDYIVREDGNRDTLRTFAAKSPYMNGMTAVMAVVREGKVTLSGFYGLTQFDGWGYGHESSQYKRILYFKRSDAWKQLLYIAGVISYTEISYAK